MLFFYHFFQKIKIFEKQQQKSLFKRKSIFFKKRFNSKVVISKRLSFVLKKDIKTNGIFFSKPKGNFFFKKFFFKTLLKCRKYLSKFYIGFKKIRQYKLTKKILQNTKNFFYKNYSYEYSVLNILLRSGFFLFPKDATIAIRINMVYINGFIKNDTKNILQAGDCLQINITYNFLLYYIFFKKFLKKKIFLHKRNAWIFFKENFLVNLPVNKKFKKRKNPNYLYLLFLYKFNTPKFLEVDFTTLSLFFLKKMGENNQTTCFFKKNFSLKMFSLYNFKKIN